MVEKRELLGMLAKEDIRDLNMVLEMLQGLRSIREVGDNVDCCTIMDPLHKAVEKNFGEPETKKVDPVMERINANLKRCAELEKELDHILNPKPVEVKNNKTMESDMIVLDAYIKFKSKSYNSILKDIEEIRRGVEASSDILNIEDISFEREDDLVVGRLNIFSTLTKEKMQELSKKGVIL